jgi:hypothetical protein
MKTTDQRTEFADALSSEILQMIVERADALGDENLAAAIMTTMQMAVSKAIVAALGPKDQGAAIDLFSRQMREAVPMFRDRELAKVDAAGNA